MEQGFVGIGDYETTVHNTNISVGGSANTKGSYVEIVASTGIDYDCILIHFYSTEEQDSYLWDIAIGAAASEEIIIPDLSIQCAWLGGGDESAETPYFFPVSIPAGTRIAVRGQCDTGNENSRVAITGFRGSFDGLPTGSYVAAHNINTANSKLTTSASNGTWVELQSSLADDALGFYLSYHSTNSTNDWSDNSIAQSDVGVGAAASEETIQVSLLGGEDSNVPMASGYYPMPIPAGTRISMLRTDLNGGAAYAVAFYTVH